MNDRRTSLLWVCFLVLLPMGMLYPLWSSPLSAGEDDVLYYYPLRKFVGESLAGGQWPISDPTTAGGMAVFADPQSAVGFPTTWLFAVVDAKLAYSLSLFFAFATAGLGMWVYLRRLGLLRPAAGFGAVAFMLSGFLIGHRVHLSLIQTAAFLPWGLWCIERLRRRGAGGAWAAMVPVFSLAVLAGHWPTVIHMAWVWAVYFCFRARPIGRAVLVTVAAGALVVCLTAPQWIATTELLRQATRTKIGYAAAGENSYFPLSAMMWFFPFLFGTRWASLYPQGWWGAWHFCETLGYVGLITLVLAGATVWTQRHGNDKTACVVRTWSWLILGAMIFMLGYYLPTYRLVYFLPVLGWVRCPARMLLAVDTGLATLAAVGVHRLIGNDPPAGALRRAVSRGSRRVLPMVMVAVLITVGVLAMLCSRVWPGALPWPMHGTWRDAIRAILPTNPAVWIPLLLAAGTSVAAWFWLRRPGVRWPVVLALLLTDLFFVVRFVDMPYPGAAPPDPEVSPAAAWLKQNAPNDRPYRIWGLGDPYGRRQPELLLARTNRVHGIASISTYGPFQNPAHAHFLGFRIFGTNRDWRWLLGRNDLLAACGVRYVLVEAGGEFDTAIQAPRRKIEAEETLPCDSWTLAHAKRRGDVMVFRTPWLWRPGEAKQRIPVEPNTAYRLSMDLRAPHGGAAGYLQVDLQDAEARADYGKPPAAMVVAPEQIGEDDWRRFEWTFPPAGEMCDEAVVRIFTFSERPIEVRNLRIGACVEDNDAPRKAGYRRVASLPALRAGDPEIRIYENTSLIPPGEVAAMTPEQIEAIKWSPAPPQAVPEMGVSPSSAGPGYWLWRATLPAAGAYLLVILGMRIRRNRTGTRPISGG